MHDETWVDLVDDQASRQPNRVALRGLQDRGLTYAELVRSSQDLDSALRDLGLQRGDVLLALMGNSPTYAAGTLGVHRAGCILATCSLDLSEDEACYQIRHSGARAIVTDSANAERALRLAATTNLSFVVMADAGHGWTVHGTGRRCARATDHMTDVPRPNDLATIMYTSGTTSRPKGVRLLHGNYLYNHRVLVDLYGYHETDVGLALFPFYHANGHLYHMTNWLMSGMEIVVPGRFSASRFGEQVLSNNITVVSLNATHVKMILAHPGYKDEDQNSLRFVKTALNLDPHSAGQFQRRFRTVLRKSYSSTETIAPVLALPSDDGDLALHPAEILGRPVRPHYEVALLDEDEQPVPQGTPGEICVRSPSRFGICDGYLSSSDLPGPPGSTQWWHTQDIGICDSEGRVHFADRKKDMIKRAGHNIATAEVERALAAHPDVSEAAVFGVPDPMREESVAAVVVTSAESPPDQDEIIQWCSKLLAPYKVPESVQVVSEIPRDGLGKVDKKSLRSSWTPADRT